MTNKIAFYFCLFIFITHDALSYGQGVEIISQDKIRSGERVSVVLRFFNSDDTIDSTLTTTVTISSGQANMGNSIVKVVRGLGSISTIVTSSADFNFSVSGYSGDKRILVKNNPPEAYHSGEITSNQTWAADHLHIISDDLLLSAGVTLTISSGAQVYLAKKVNFEIHGRLRISGTSDSPVLFSAENIEDPWGGIELLEGSEQSELSYAIFTAGGADDNRIFGHSSSQPVLKASDTELHMADCFFIDNIGKAIATNESINEIANGLISRCDTGAEFRYSNTHVSGLYVLFIPDEDGIADDNDNDGLYVWDRLTADPQNTIVERVVIYGTEDEGIDLNSQAHIRIYYSFISHCFDKGFSVGNQSDARFIADIITHCQGAGVGAKDNSIAYIENCTLYSNEIGLLGYTKNQGGGGGNIEAKNLIISQSVDRSYSEDANSDLQISYSMSDNDQIPGSTNLMSDPMFIAPANLDFGLSPGSPAVDAGDPNSNHDPDGSRRDMGAVPSFQTQSDEILLTEIAYRPLIEGVEDQDLEFIELYNYGSQGLNLQNYSFTAGFIFTFPDNTYLAAGDYLIIAEKASSWTGIGVQVHEWASGSLSNTGETISLENATGQSVFSVSYSNSSPWPVSANYYNYSIELNQGAIDAGDGTQWHLSYQYGGSPGHANTEVSLSDLVINEFMASNSGFITDEFGNFSDWIELYNPTGEYLNIAGAYFSIDFNDPEMSMVPATDFDHTTIAPDGFLLLWADSKPERGVLHLAFSLHSQGGEVSLAQNMANSTSFVDQITYDVQQTDLSYGRFPDGGDGFEVFSIPTPGDNNQLEHDELLNGLFINEFVAKFGVLYPDEHGNFSDWIEIYNDNTEAIDIGGLYMTDVLSNPEKFKIPFDKALETTIPAKGFIVLRADKRPDLGSLHLDFELASHGEEIGLAQKMPEGMVFIDQVVFGQQTPDISTGRYPDGGDQFIFFDPPSPGLSNSTEVKEIQGVFINEFVANYGSAYADEHGNFSDWIELYNSNNEAVDIGGLFLTDVLEEPVKWQLPNDTPEKTTIPANGYLVMWADGNPALGPLHLNFQLRSHGEAIGLNQEILGTVSMIDEVSFGLQSIDVSYGRLPDGSSHWEFFEQPSPGATNSSSSSSGLALTRASLVDAFPNPAGDLLFIVVSLTEPGPVKIALFNSNGKKVRELNNSDRSSQSREANFRINLSDYPFGLYFLSVEVADRYYYKKVVHTSR